MSTIIVGAGLAGLYYALKHKKSAVSRGSDPNILLLEQSDRIGGRIGQVNFHGVDVVYGAGIGRYDKDILLKKLLDDLEVEYNLYTTSIYYILPKVVDILKSLKTLARLYDPSIRSSATFRDFLKLHMNQEDIYNWVCSSGYTDYLNADIYDTLLDYGFDDNVGGYKAMGIPWNKVLNKLETLIKKKGVDIRLNSKVTGISVRKNSEKHIVVKTNNGIYKCDKLILAIPSPNIRKLLKNPIYDQVRVQTFCRLYIKIDKDKSKDFVENIQGFTFVEPPLQKIIPWKEQGVYMISYSDNKSADYVKDLSDKDLETLVYNTTKYRIKIIDKLVFYFKVGTHYYTPLNISKYKDRVDFLKKAQNPQKDIYVIGEGFSQNQGWCEGALESVKAVMKN